MSMRSRARAHRSRARKHRTIECAYRPPTTTLIVRREPSFGCAASPRQLHAGSTNALLAAQHCTENGSYSSALRRAGGAGRVKATVCGGIVCLAVTSSLLAAAVEVTTNGWPTPVRHKLSMTRCNTICVLAATRYACSLQHDMRARCNTICVLAATLRSDGTVTGNGRDDQRQQLPARDTGTLCAYNSQPGRTRTYTRCAKT
jgi:hypothetical protein